MQSHASRHVASEFLQDRHPDLSPPFPKAVIADEIAVAYGRRGLQKLISVLALDDLPDEDRAHALRVFNGLLSTQENKTDAIHDGAPPPLQRLVRISRSQEVRQLSCEALASLAQIIPGRAAIAGSSGLQALTTALQTTPEAAAGAMKQFSYCADGLALLLPHLSTIVPALVQLITVPPGAETVCPPSMLACENAAATLAGITANDAGIFAALESHVPKALVGLAHRGLTGDFRYEERLLDALEQISSCLEQLCHHNYGKTAVREAGGIQVMTAFCKLHGHRLVTKKCTSAFMALSIEKESKEPIMLVAGSVLVKLLKGDDAELSANARDAIVSCCENLEARRLMEALLPEHERIALLFGGPQPQAPPDYRYPVILPHHVAQKFQAL